MLPTTLRTERLLLRPWCWRDVSDVVAYANDVEWARYLPIPQPYGEEDASRFVAAQLFFDVRQQFAWAIEADGRAVGGINVRFFAEHRVAEMGWSVARALWGRGLTTEAARAVLRAVFEGEPRVQRVRSNADVRNAGSWRIMEKLGMKREGVLRGDRFVRDEPVDAAHYAILRSEWR